MHNLFPKSIGNILSLTIALFAIMCSVTNGQMKKFPLQNPNQSYYQSVILTAPNSNLLFFRIENYYELVQSISNDNGLNWYEYGAIDTSDYWSSQALISGLTSASGRIFIFYKFNSNNYYYCKYSDNSGFTWSSKIKLATGTDSADCIRARSGVLSQSSSGKLFFVYSKLDTVVKNIYYITSSNNGLTWSAEYTFAAGPLYGSITSTSENKLMMVYQNNGIFYSVSTDDGITWGTSTAIESNNLSINTPKILKDQTGNLWLFYQKNVTTPFTGFTQSDIVYRTSSDNGASWGLEADFSKYKGFDGYYNISIKENYPLVSFYSARQDNLGNYYTLWYGTAGVTQDNYAPPYMYQSVPSVNPPTENQQFNITAWVDGTSNITSVILNSNLNGVVQSPITMYDDGTHGDTTADDKIYTCQVPGIKTGEAILTSINITDQITNSVTYTGPAVAIPIPNTSEGVMIDANKFKLPIGNNGILADLYTEGATLAGGRYDSSLVLFSAGFYMTGKSNGNVWSNGSLSASRITDYVQGKIGTITQDPKNVIYVVRSSDPPFGQSWQSWKYAVSQGADFYDGSNDGVYNPVDLNGNGKWDKNEDRPDLLGDITAWCVYNDGLPSLYRTFNDVSPQGIEIQQSVFAKGDTTDLNNVIFVRYRIINRGTVADNLESVYFGTAADIDIGTNGLDDLVGCDSLINAGYIYHSGTDPKWGETTPAEIVALLQGPLSYIPGTTFNDINANGTYDSGIDIPFDTAFSFKGPLLGIKNYPGAKNLNVSSSLQYYNGIDPQEKFQLSYYLMGRDNTGAYINPCTWSQGAVYGGANCAVVNPVFMYSGDPVTNTGWINVVPRDQRIIQSSGPFTLEKNKPVDILVAHLVGRGNSPLNSITVAKNYAVSTGKYYGLNFPDPALTGIRDLSNNITDFRLDQNYPNPFNPSTKIRFSIKTNSLVTLKVYNILGKEVAVILNEEKRPGSYELDFSAGKFNLASGVYFYRMQAGTFTSVKKMILLK
jgi:hypothetical protein